jgi:hypothetical protein
VARRGVVDSDDFLIIDDDLNEGGETPRMPAASGVRGFEFNDAEREREREFLESLRFDLVSDQCSKLTPGFHVHRSPDLENQRGSIGGWGLGNWSEGDKKAKEADAIEDEDEEMDWDQAQAVVERMVGMKPLENSEPQRTEGRRKLT